MADEKAWAEYWSGAEGAEAVGGVYRHKLAAHWTSFFNDAGVARSKAPVVVVIAAGAGVALASAIEAHAGNGLFVALDYSAAAVGSALKAHIAAKGVAANAACLPFRVAFADLVISQFGIEYAGEGAFVEAARILAPGG